MAVSASNITLLNCEIDRGNGGAGGSGGTGGQGQPGETGGLPGMHEGSSSPGAGGSGAHGGHGADGAAGSSGVLDVDVAVAGPEPQVTVMSPAAAQRPARDTGSVCDIGCFTLDVPRPAAASLEFAGVTPNPVAPGSALRFSLPLEARVTIALFDASGRQVGEVCDRTFAAGPHALAWETAATGMRTRRAGLYFVRFEALGRVFVRRAVVLK